jgi:hypothetical protein
MAKDILRKLEEHLGPLRARQRLGIETDHEAKIFGKGLLSFHNDRRLDRFPGIAARLSRDSIAALDRTIEGRDVSAELA